MGREADPRDNKQKIQYKPPATCTPVIPSFKMSSTLCVYACPSSVLAGKPLIYNATRQTTISQQRPPENIGMPSMPPPWVLYVDFWSYSKAYTPLFSLHILFTTIATATFNTSFFSIC
jgi:hypothetical protein